MSYRITREDALKRVYFITKLVQNQKGDTMSGALTSKSDSMGGIFDRFINSISEDIVFDKIILPEINTTKNVSTLKDYYLYKPLKNGVGIAPDVFGLKVDEKLIPFTRLEDKWTPVDGMPQIEVKTFKAKDQMISLRNQDYESKYLVMTNLNLRIDYLVPFLDPNILNECILPSMEMKDQIFVDPTKKGIKKINKVSKIDYSSNDIGEIELISVTNGAEFLHQATLCGPNVSVRRMKEFKKRKTNIKTSTNHMLSEYTCQSSHISRLYEFNDLWYSITNINKNNELHVDFSGTNLKNIEILAFNKNSIVIKALAENCSFNENLMESEKQYTVNFETLSRVGNNGAEHFMQKECAKYLTSHKEELVEKLKKIINN